MIRRAGAGSRRFEDRVVWITGASAGIGEATAKAFAREGARLIVSSRRRAVLERVAAECEGAAGVDVLPFDLEDIDALPAIARAGLALNGHVDVMVHNAGISQRALALETAIAVDERLMRVDYLSVVALTKALLPAMIARGAGQLVVVTSLTGLMGSPLRSSYAAAKHALHGFFDSLRAEHARDGISVTLVCPGFVHTSVSINALRGDGSPQGTMDPATARGISPERCAAAIVRGTADRKIELYVGGAERIGVYIKRASPRLFAFALSHARTT